MPQPTLALGLPFDPRRRPNMGGLGTCCSNGGARAVACLSRNRHFRIAVSLGRSSGTANCGWSHAEKGSMRPWRTARTPSSVRLRAPSLRSTLWMCERTVSTLTPRLIAISSSLRPATSDCSTSRSLRVKLGGGKRGDRRSRRGSAWKNARTSSSTTRTGKHAAKCAASTIAFEGRLRPSRARATGREDGPRPLGARAGGFELCGVQFRLVGWTGLRRRCLAKLCGADQLRLAL
jgi:hypothetical protein